MASLYISAEKETREVLIEMENIQKTYLLGVEGVPALRGVTMKIYKGEFLIIYGTSGGGKTSLLNIIGTIDRPTKGRLTIGGSRITNQTSDSLTAELRLKKMGFVFQTFNLLSTMTAQQNVEMPMVLLGKSSQKERAKRAKILLEKVGMGARLDHLPSQLSGGEQQRTTIARAIANQPEILLLDEPTGDLDTKNTLIVMDLLCKLNEEEGITCVMVTHDPSLKYVANRVVMMRDGKIAKIDIISEEEMKSGRKELREKLSKILTESGEKMDQDSKSVRNIFTILGTENDQIILNGKKQISFPVMSKYTEVRKPKDYETFSQDGFLKANEIIEETKKLILNDKVAAVSYGEIVDNNNNKNRKNGTANDDGETRIQVVLN